MKLPKKLCAGDTVAVVSPASPLKYDHLEKVAHLFKLLNLNPVYFPSVYKRHGHLSGIDSVRAKDINDAFADENIKGIFALRGGYGTPRILNLIDYEAIINNPKIFIGFSDITALHLAINKKANLVTFHGPNAFCEDIVNHPRAYTISQLNRCLFDHTPLGLYVAPENEPLSIINGGKCSGQIIGGNLSMLVSTLGSPYEVDTRGKILFIEEVSEKNYTIDKMLMALDLSGKFKDCEGILLGTWHGCVPDHGSEDKIDGSLESIFKEILLKYNKPTLNNFRAGHVEPQFTIPLGTTIELDADQKKVVFLTSSTR